MVKCYHSGPLGRPRRAAVLGRMSLDMSLTLRSDPRRDGYWMPAEFEPHEGTWMLWPERPDNWRRQAQPAQQAFAAVAAAIARFEPVTVGASPQQYARAR